jgi:hypothetical protein
MKLCLVCYIYGSGEKEENKDQLLYTHTHTHTYQLIRNALRFFKWVGERVSFLCFLVCYFFYCVILFFCHDFSVFIGQIILSFYFNCFIPKQLGFTLVPYFLSLCFWLLCQFLFLFFLILEFFLKRCGCSKIYIYILEFLLFLTFFGFFENIG